MKKLLILSVFIWYFGLRIMTDEPNVYVSWVQGPYKTEKACKQAYEEAKEMLKMLGSDFKGYPCKAQGPAI